MSRLFYPPVCRRDEYPKKRKRHRYQYFRGFIRDDCGRACFYCDRHEDELGGEEEFELDHFRPSSHKDYEHLKDEPRNLVWCCQKCNKFKNSTWNEEEGPGNVSLPGGYIDRFLTDPIDYFRVTEDGDIEILRPECAWMVLRLKLKRMGLRRIRSRRIGAMATIVECIAAIQECGERILDGGPEEQLSSWIKQRDLLIGILSRQRQHYEFLFEKRYQGLPSQAETGAKVDGGVGQGSVGA